MCPELIVKHTPPLNICNINQLLPVVQKWQRFSLPEPAMIELTLRLSRMMVDEEAE